MNRWLSLTLLISALALLSCNDDGRPVVSLDEAKRITTEMRGKGFAPPPRTIDDLTAILDQFKPEARAMKLTIVQARDPAALEADENHGLEEPETGLIVMPGPFTAVHRELLVRIANLHRVPAIYPYRYYAASGGLMSYGIDLVAQLRLAAQYVSRILKGEKPGDLPVQQPPDFEFVVNLKTARQLGIELPPTFVARANEVIE